MMPVNLGVVYESDIESLSLRRDTMMSISPSAALTLNHLFVKKKRLSVIQGPNTDVGASATEHQGSPARFRWEL